MRHFRLAAIAGAFALSALAYSATAQSVATSPATAQPAAATGPARAPIDLYLQDPVFRSADISPNGQYVVAIHRETVGDVITVLDLQAHHISRVSVARADQDMRISAVWFKADDRIIFVVRQHVRITQTRSTMFRNSNVQDSFEWDSRIYSSNIDGSDIKTLYDPSAQQGFDRSLEAGLVSSLDSDPDHVLLIVPGMGGWELWRVNIRTATHTVVEQGDVNTRGWEVDRQGTPVMRQEAIANNRGFAWQRRGPGQNSWTEVARFTGAQVINSGPTFQVVGAASQPGQMFVVARRDGDDTMGLFVFDTATGQYVQTLSTPSGADVRGPIYDERTGRLLAVCSEGERRSCTPLDQAFGHHWNGLLRALSGDLSVGVSSFGGADSSRWLVATHGPQDLGTYYIFDTNAHTLNALFSMEGDIDPRLLPTERVVHYAASDGQQLWGYLWTPPGVTNARNLPLVVVPHGGPEYRDFWAADAFAPYLAAQGYAVFQPNFRGGGGFGRHFVEAGYRQWGMRMQDDVTDGTRYLVQQGIADAHRMCIMGWSYGGYVAMTASFQNTDLFKCSVAGAGISDMSAMLRWTRDGDTQRYAGYSGGGAGGSSPTYDYWSTTMGHFGADDASFTAHSAAQNANRVGMPLLLIHGDRDTVVPHSQSELMQTAMQRAGHPVRLVTLEGSDHSPDTRDQMRTVLSESLGFIQQNIGPGVAPGSQ
ncbi:MAG: alpha/beta fold hydrolase [Vitreimonas sp.]